MTEVIEQNEESVGDLVRRLEKNYISGTIKPSKYVTMSPSEDVNRIYAYLDSKHISGETDSLGREKPFFNIVLAARNIWFRSTDLDRKNIRIPATKSGDVITSFLATAKLHEWMKRENFGTFLNDWGINSAGFNESVLKFVKKDGRLIPSVTPWNKIICDFIDFKNNPKIELLELTEAQLYKSKYNKTQIKALCDALRARETLEKQHKDTNNSKYVKLYEVHGEFSQAVYKKAKGLEVKEGDSEIYFQQTHVVSFVESKDPGKYQDFTLYSGKEEKDPYMLAALLPEVDGSIALKGSVKTLFESQWMENHSVKAIKDQLDVASKLVFQTSDGNFVGQNVLTSIESGDILIHEFNRPLTQINNGSHDITSLQNFGQMWKNLGNEITGVSESMLGVTPKSGTAWRQTEAILEESHSLFEIMMENRGLDTEEMLREHVIPFLKTQLDTTDEIATTLESYGIDRIDSVYIKNTAVRRNNKKKLDTVLNAKLDGSLGDEMTGIPEIAQEEGMVRDQLSTLGTQRFLKPSEISSVTWKKKFKDFEWTAEVDITNENINREAMTTINTLITLLADPARAQFFETPKGKFLFNKALELTNAVSPIELSSIPSTPPPAQQEVPATPV